MAAAAAAPARAEVLSLYRALLREGRKFSNYNVREYVSRRAREAFREHRQVADPEAVERLIGRAREQLEVARRQVVVYSLFAPRLRSIMDLKSLKEP